MLKSRKNEVRSEASCRASDPGRSDTVCRCGHRRRAAIHEDPPDRDSDPALRDLLFGPVEAFRQRNRT